jgi:hypothetical protein
VGGDRGGAGNEADLSALLESGSGAEFVVSGLAWLALRLVDSFSLKSF